jgi:glycosyl transferase family 25
MPSNGAIPVYVINLDRSPQRLDHMGAQLGRLGIAFERLRAVDGRELKPDYVAGFPPMSASQIGCFLSHKLAWQRIAEGDAPYGIVLEDDIHIAPGFADLTRSTNWIPVDAGTVKLETFLLRVSMDKMVIGGADEPVLRRMRTFHPGTGAYALSVRAAEHLLRTRPAPVEPADDAMFYVEDWWRHLPAVYQLVPAVCIQDFVLPQRERIDGLATTMEFPTPINRRAGYKMRREMRRIWRQLHGFAAIVVGIRPSFTRQIVPFAEPLSVTPPAGAPPSVD